MLRNISENISSLFTASTDDDDWYFYIRQLKENELNDGLYAEIAEYNSELQNKDDSACSG